MTMLWTFKRATGGKLSKWRAYPMTCLTTCTGAVLSAVAPVASAAGPGAEARADAMHMFLGATPAVQAVMLLLVVASILSWATLFVKGRELMRAGRSLSLASERVTVATTLSEVVGFDDPAVRTMVEEVRDECSRSETSLRSGLVDGFKERVAARLQRAEDGFTGRMGQGLGIVAGVASVTPFVGLFGTVWGIMHSFVDISAANTTSLAVVAPGIAEALLATGLGLAAAIPATLMYNALGRRVAAYRAQLADCATTLMCLVSRDADRSQIVDSPPVAVLRPRAASHV